MRREHVELGPGVVVAYGHWGRPLLVFPSEQGRALDFENNGMVDAVADLIEGGRVKLYCVDSADAQTWSNQVVPIEERARRHADVFPLAIGFSGNCDPSCLARKAFDTNWRCGDSTSHTIGLRGGRSFATTCRASVEGG